MRKIHFNEETIEQIRSYFAEGHTMAEGCNKFTLKYATLRRVMYENNIPLILSDGVVTFGVSEEDKNIICNLYKYSDMSIKDIAKVCKIPEDVVNHELDQVFSTDYRNNRISRLRRLKVNDETVVEDGDGYLMELRPEWWTSRAKSKYVYQHHIIMAIALGLTQIPKGFVVHHVDNNKQNNTLSNLALLQLGAHEKWHSMLKNLCKVQRLSKDGVEDK